MKKTELKKVLKPIIKECIREALFEEGILSSIISEVVHGLNAPRRPIVEQRENNEDEMRKLQLEQKQKRSQQIDETRKKMLDAIGGSSYNGADLFEGTMPVASAGSPGDAASPQGPLTGVDPNDAGVDISGLMGNFSAWKTLAKG
tara:strand:+ start:216 stop:650 length:435 start_codon:yes stop_codon:yes gene_type:complete